MATQHQPIKRCHHRWIVGFEPKDLSYLLRLLTGVEGGHCLMTAAALQNGLTSR